MSYLVSPFNALNQINRELNRFFDDRPLGSSVQESGNWAPHVDIAENEEAFTVLADVPGVKPEDIQISLHNGVLTIRGERTSDSNETYGGFTRRERIRGNFSRQFHLPELASEESVSAKSNHGVLEITIPKAKKATPINITVEEE